jgi:hypothetical protein
MLHIGKYKILRGRFREHKLRSDKLGYKLKLCTAESRSLGVQPFF